MGNVCSWSAGDPAERHLKHVVKQLEDEYPWARKQWLRKQVRAVDGDLEQARIAIEQKIGGARPFVEAHLSDVYGKGGDISHGPVIERGKAYRGSEGAAKRSSRASHAQQADAGPDMQLVPPSMPLPGTWPAAGTPDPSERVITTLFNWNGSGEASHPIAGLMLRQLTRMRFIDGIRKARMALSVSNIHVETCAEPLQDAPGAADAIALEEDARSRTSARVTRAVSSQRRRRSTSVRRRTTVGLDQRYRGSGGAIPAAVSPEQASAAASSDSTGMVLVLDMVTLSIVTSLCRLQQLRQLGIDTVQVLNDRKSPVGRNGSTPATTAASVMTFTCTDASRNAHRGDAIKPHIYFVTSVPASVEAMALHLETTAKARLSEGADSIQDAVLISGHLPDEALGLVRQQLAHTSLLQRLGCFMEIRLDYVAIEEGLFHFCHPSALIDLFPASRSKTERLRQERCLAIEAQQLASVCEVTAGVEDGSPWLGNVYFVRGAGTEDPASRLASESLVGGAAPAEQLAQLLAHELRRRWASNMPHAAQAAEASVSKTETGPALTSRLAELAPGKRPGPVDVLICDRTVDLATLFMHDFHYAAMAMDLCEGSQNACARVRIPLTEIGLEWDLHEPISAAEVDLDEELDAIWREVRHRHIADAVDALSATFDAYLDAEPGVAAVIRQPQRRNLDAESAQRPEWYRIPQARAACATAQEALDTFLAHFALIEVLLTRFSDWSLDRVAAMEQDLACCRTSRGRRFRHALRRALAVAEHPNVRVMDKLRVALLYLVTQDVGAGDLERLLEVLRGYTIPSSFTNDFIDGGVGDARRAPASIRADIALRTVWDYLSVALGTEMRKSRAERRERRERSRSRSRSRTRRDSWSNLSTRGPGDEGSADEASDDFELCRYNNRLAVILRQFAENVFRPECAYPLATDLGAAPSPKYTSPVTPRSGAPSGLKPSPVVSQTPLHAAGQSGNGALAGATCEPTLIVYVAGGIMPSEARDVYRFAQRTGRVAVAGGSCMLTPREVLALLCRREAVAP